MAGLSDLSIRHEIYIPISSPVVGFTVAEFPQKNGFKRI